MPTKTYEEQLVAITQQLLDAKSLKDKLALHAEIQRLLNLVKGRTMAEVSHLHHSERSDTNK